MLKVIEGNLWDYAVGQCIIAHGCNPLGKMGAGFAKEVRDRFPENFLEYRQWCLNNRVKVGQWLYVYEKTHEQGRTVTKGIFNMITQETYGNDPNTVYVDYDAVKKGLTTIAAFSQKNPDYPLHFPFIGAGKANGDPKVLMAIFEEVFAETDAMLYVLPSSK